MAIRATGVALLLAVFFLTVGFGTGDNSRNAKPVYTSGGQLQLPKDYRDWIYLSSGFDMSYSPAAQASSHHVFDNVFVNPAAHRVFVETGTWPDNTMFILEHRGAVNKGSINQGGSYQSTAVQGLEAHVKDSRRFPGKWAFFGFGSGEAGQVIPQSATCYSCHAAHAAVDTTFVQFYPTLLPVAKSKGTLTAAYLKESGSDQK
jgi:hypothetical protein